MRKCVFCLKVAIFRATNDRTNKPNTEPNKKKTDPTKSTDQTEVPKKTRRPNEFFFPML